MIDSLAVPERSFDALHDEVVRRSARIRSARRRRAGLATAVVASVVALGTALGAGPAAHRVSTPAGPPAADPPVDAGAVASPTGGVDAAPAVGVGRSNELPVAPAVGRPVTPTSPLRTWVLFNDGGLSEVDGRDGTKRPVHSPGALELRWSPDGTSLVRTHGNELWVGDRRIFDGSEMDGASAPAWLPDGRSVLFVRRQGLVEPVHALWVVDVATGATTHVRGLSGGGVTPTVGPDGRIAYQCVADGYARLCLTDGTGADLGIVPRSDWYGHLSWSPDGAWIAVTTGLGGDSSGVMLLRPDGSARQIVLRDRVTRRPVWFPDSSRLVVDLLPPDSVAPDNRPCTQAPCPDATGIWSMALDGRDARLVVDAYPGALLDARAAD